jgi:hypothetical protein
MRLMTSPSWRRASASPSRRWAPTSPFLMELSREEQPNKMRTGGGAAGEDEGGGRSSRICIRVRDAVGDGEHRVGRSLGGR